MSIHESRSSSKWNAIRSRAVPSSVTVSADSSLLNPRVDHREDDKRKDVLPAKLYRSSASLKSSVPHSSNYK